MVDPQVLLLGSQKPEQQSCPVEQNEPSSEQVPRPHVLVCWLQKPPQQSVGLKQKEPSGMHMVLPHVPVCGLQKPSQQSSPTAQGTPGVPQLSQVSVRRSQAPLQHWELSLHGWPNGWQGCPPQAPLKQSPLQQSWEEPHLRPSCVQPHVLNGLHWPEQQSFGPPQKLPSG